MLSFVVLLTACLILGGTWLFLKQPKERLPLPPGPKRLPLIGNLLDMPRKHEWKTFTKWREEYGDVVYLEVVGKPIVLLNSAEAVNELMRRRSAIYSSRPRFPLIDFIGQDWNLGFMSYGKDWQARKTLVLSKYSKNAVRCYRPAAERANALFLTNVLKDSEHLADHLRLHSGQLVIEVTYGILVTSLDNELIHIAEELMNNVTIGLTPIFWIFNPVPMIERLRRLPCTGWLDRIVYNWRKSDQQLRDVPYEMVKSAVEKGTAKTSYISTLLDELEDSTPDKETLIRDTAALAYGAGADTALAAYSVFFVAMYEYPEVQKKAQEEIDRVIGNNRLPVHSDQADLPYIMAVMKESLRWHAATPQGIAHANTEADIYNGMYIPANSMIVPNVWGILRDPIVYENPSVFMPERFISGGELHTEGKDPADFIFGFGRRNCAGEHFAQETFFLLIAQFLAVFEIKSANGRSPQPVQWTSGGVLFPEPYPYVISPRSDQARALVNNLQLVADL